MNNKITYITNTGYKKLKEELDWLKNTKRKEVSTRIKEAKELGDISENAEYADAREEQSFTEGRIIEVEDILKNAEIVDSKNSNPNKVEVGDFIVVKQNSEQKEYTIVGASEADPSQGKISNESPIGKAFVGKKKGESFIVKTPKRELKCEILKINPKQ